MKSVSFYRSARRLLSSFWRHKRGNIALVVAASAVPLTLAMGVSVDYTLASFKQDQINGLADAATLAAVTPTMMATQSAAQSQAKAQSFFLAELTNVPGVTYSASNVSVTASDVTNAAVITRTVHLSYTVSKSTIFSSLLGVASVNVSGQSSATSTTAPNINFYMLLDDSPSMAIAATEADISTMVAATSHQGGCAFACHESDPAADNLGNPQGEDNYTLARNLGVRLRIDNVNDAVNSLLSTAKITQGVYNTTYNFALFTMDYNLSAIGAYSQPTALQTILNAPPTISAIEVYNNGCLTPTNCNNDTDSYLDANMGNLNTGYLVNPGNGTNNTGDSPQEVLFVVTDGVNDYYSGPSRIMVPLGVNYSNCTAIKNRGIRIAMLYLTYYPLPTNGFYNSNIAPFQSSIAPDAENCASPGLFYQVDTGGDITAAMTALFQRAVATARLSQ